MAVPIKGAAATTHTRAAQDGTLDPAQNSGGVYIDGGSASASAAITTRRPLGSDSVGPRGPQLNTSADGAFHTKLCNDGAVFAYGVAGKYIMIGAGGTHSGQDTIAGLSNLAMRNAGANCHRGINFKVAQLGAGLLTAHRSGFWQPWVPKSMATATRHSWSTYPAALTAAYKDANGSGDAVDKAARPSRAVPGQLVTLESHSNWNPHTDYGDVSGNFDSYKEKHSTTS